MLSVDVGYCSTRCCCCYDECSSFYFILISFCKNSAAKRHKMNFVIPIGLTDMLQEFTVEVLRQKPDDLVSFAARYFTARKKRLTLSKSVHIEPDRESKTSEKSASRDQPLNRFLRRQSVSAEGYDPEVDTENEKIQHPKTDEQRERLASAVTGILLFRSLEPDQMQDVLDAMFEKKVDVDDHVIDQGDDGDNFYIIDKGSYDIFVDIEGNRKLVGSYNNQGSFGELALMYNMPRAATIIATTVGVLWVLDGVTFRRIVLKNAFNKRRTYEDLLQTVPMLSYLDNYERMNLADALFSMNFEDGQQIIKQGDEADCMYFVEAGDVRITMAKLDGGPEVQINQCSKGDYFGELALLTNRPRAASAYSVKRTRCAVLDVAAFERLLGPCMEIMKRNIDGYESQLIEVFGTEANITDLR